MELFCVTLTMNILCDMAQYYKLLKASGSMSSPSSNLDVEGEVELCQF